MKYVEWTAEFTAPEIPRDFLRWLKQPTVVRIPGHDRNRCRAVSVLLHGNEPSGLIALHNYLRSGAVPAVDLLCTISAIDAALEPPLFSKRMLPGRRDLNRCFAPPYSDEDGAIARDLLTHLRKAKCEAVVDLHNNSGHNPAYGVITKIDNTQLGLVALFAHRCVVTPLRLSTLIEALENELPAVTIECGRSGDTAADALATHGLARYAALDVLPIRPRTMQLYENPVRVCLGPDATIAFSNTPVPDVSITLRPDVDAHNFERLSAGAAIGWTTDRQIPLRATCAGGKDVTTDILSIKDGVIRLRRAAVPIMMTTDPEVAAQDCLCYLVTPSSNDPT